MPSQAKGRERDLVHLMTLRSLTDEKKSRCWAVGCLPFLQGWHAKWCILGRPVQNTFYDYPVKEGSLWHVDYFELKAIKTQQIWGKLFSPFTAQKNVDHRPGPEWKQLPETAFYLQWQTPGYQTPTLLMFLWSALHLSEASDSIWILSSGWQRSLNCLTAFESSIFMRLQCYRIKFGFLLVICPMSTELLEQPKNLEG